MSLSGFIILAAIMLSLGFAKGTLAKRNIPKWQMVKIGFLVGVVSSLLFFSFAQFIDPEVSSRQGREQEQIILVWHFAFPFICAFYFWPFKFGD